MLRTIVKHKGWKRPAKYVPNIVQAILNGTSKPEDYPYVDFSSINFKNPPAKRSKLSPVNEINLQLTHPGSATVEKIIEDRGSLLISISLQK